MDYFMVSWHLAMKLFTAKCHERTTMRKLEGVVLIHSGVKMSQRSSAHSLDQPRLLGRGVQFFVRLPDEIFFTICNVQPYNLEQLGYVFLGVCRVSPPDLAAEHHIVPGLVWWQDVHPSLPWAKYRQKSYYPVHPLNNLIAISQILGDT